MNKAAGFIPELVLLFPQMGTAEFVHCSDGTSHPRVTSKKTTDVNVLNHMI